MSGFPFDAKEWLSDPNVSAMTPAQEGAYIRLLCHAWLSDDCSIPDDDQQLAVMSRLGEGWFNGGSTVVRKCFESTGTTLRNGSLFLLKERQKQWSEKSRQGGLRSGQSRRCGKITQTAKEVEPPFALGSEPPFVEKTGGIYITTVESSVISSKEAKPPISNGKHEPALAGDVRAVYEHYRSYHPRACPTLRHGSKEAKLIRARLVEGYSVDDLKAAIDGNHRSPFHNGENPGGTKYNSLELIMRDNSQVQKFIEEPASRTVLSEKNRRSVNAAQSLLKKEFGDDYGQLFRTNGLAAG